ncbi:MAG: hypothetical protein PX483_05170 [Nostocales cyanobacterium LE14-WE4]|nr:hypothetical protein [Nostocales cyanobacterium LE14-WE4]
MSVGLRCRLTRPTKNGQGIDPTFRTLTVTHQQKASLVVFMN